MQSVIQTVIQFLRQNVPAPSVRFQVLVRCTQIPSIVNLSRITSIRHMHNPNSIYGIFVAEVLKTPINIGA